MGNNGNGARPRGAAPEPGLTQDARRGLLWCAAGMVALLLTLVMAGALAGPLRAQGAADVTAFRDAMARVAADDWAGATAAVAGAGPVARDLTAWMRLRAGSAGGSDFAAYAGFVATHPHWPGLDRLRARGEEAMPFGLPPATVLDWFAGVRPQTGQGAVHLAQALTASDRPQEAAAVLDKAWATLGLSAEGHAAMVAVMASAPAAQHWQRAQAMLWRGRATDAVRMLPLLNPDYRLLALARLAVIRGDGDRTQRVSAVPAGLRDDPGLAHDRFNRLADEGDYSDANAILLARSGSAAALGEPFRWASWRATLARWAMREGRPDDAYRLASNHHLTEGEFFADLEWVAGYVALRYLDDPAAAMTHFTAMQGAVGGPISTSRAGYWLARAQEAAGDPDAAAANLTIAARHQTAFYGLLAAERLGLPLDPTLAGTEVFADWRQGQVLHRDLTAALLLLVAADRRNDAIPFARRQAQLLDRAQIGELGRMLTDIAEPFLALTLGKEAAARDIVIPAIYFPLHPLAQMDLPVEAALALAVARRESEFNIAAGSPAGALGLMQLMPGTAREVAGELGLPYQRSRLTTDAAYNATLGARYLANLQVTFGPSPVMIAAGYNAGPSRPRTWMTQRGDPRRGQMDVIDWIEHIPFAETRTYVMRVTESIPVYRARLTGETGPIRFTDLLIGAPPMIRPVARGQTAPTRPVAVLSTSGTQTATPPVADPSPAAQTTPQTTPQTAARPPASLAPLTALRPPQRP